jgi:AcrR family transcriptional regulator
MKDVSCNVCEMKRNHKFVDARERVLETAWKMIAEQRSAAITLVDVAKRAGVSRQTVYVNFGNRAGLLLAMVEHSDETSPELVRLKTRQLNATVEQALAHVVRSWFDYIPVVFRVARALAAAGETDADAHAAIESRWQILRTGFLEVTTAMHRKGKLAPEWTPDTAADWVCHMAHVDAWQHLVIERGWSADQAVEQTVRSLMRTLCVDQPADPPTKTRKK